LDSLCRCANPPYRHATRRLTEICDISHCTISSHLISSCSYSVRLDRVWGWGWVPGVWDDTTARSSALLLGGCASHLDPTIEPGYRYCLCLVYQSARGAHHPLRISCSCTLTHTHPHPHAHLVAERDTSSSHTLPHSHLSHPPSPPSPPEYPASPPDKTSVRQHPSSKPRAISSPQPIAP
jgi:hypothetical protein